MAQDTLIDLDQATTLVPFGKTTLRRAIKAGQLQAFEPVPGGKWVLWRSELIAWATGNVAGGPDPDGDGTNGRDQGRGRARGDRGRAATRGSGSRGRSRVPQAAANDAGSEPQRGRRPARSRQGAEAPAAITIADILAA